jgi:hypothetical protein
LWGAIFILILGAWVIMLTLEETDIVFADSGEVSYCHVMCECHPTLAMCGAYKPIRCGVLVVDARNGVCPTCGKISCPDCNECMQFSCPRCGG